MNVCLFNLNRPGKPLVRVVCLENGDRGEDRLALALAVQDNGKKRTIHLQPTVVVDEAKLSELVHEEIHSSTARRDE